MDRNRNRSYRAKGTTITQEMYRETAVGTGVRDDDEMTDVMEEQDVPVHLLPWYIRTIRKLTS